MTKTILGCCIVLGLAVVLCNAEIAQAQEVNFCALPVSRAVRQANTTFNVIYEFDVSESGLPRNIKTVQKAFVEPEDVKRCIEQWRLPQFASKHLVSVFEWHHGVGWERLAVSGSGVKLTIHLTGEKCPYCGKN